jgi:NDP-mannose synthase
VILAGGKGTRLGPYTTVLPKPLLPIGDRAILDVIVRQLADHGFQRVTLAVGYLAHLIAAVYGDGSRHGVEIDYHHEQEPLGTAGALASIEGFHETFLLMNGDVLTTLDYGKLYDTHRAAGNILTIATHRRVVPVDYGVLHVDDELGRLTGAVQGYEEKPELACTVSMGVYMLEPEVRAYASEGEYLDVPDLILRLIADGQRVGAYRHDGFWLDIGRHEDYERAIEQYDSMTGLLFKEGAVARA